jgi:hypothetical protein
MIDPDTIQPTAQVTLDLPRVITVMDYHEFRHLQSFMREDLGLADVYVTEVGFDAPMYVGLVHLDTESHNQMVMELTAYYEQLEEME